MTKEQRPARAYQPWTDQEYGVLDGCRAGGVSVDTLAKGLSRYPSEVENALIKLKGLNEAMTNSQKTQAQAYVNAVDRGKEIHEAIRNYPEHLIDHYGSGLRPLDAVHKPKTSILSKEDRDGIEKRVPEGWKNKHVHDYILRKARRLIINGKDYDTILHRVKQRIRLQIEISATLARGGNFTNKLVDKS